MNMFGCFFGLLILVAGAQVCSSNYDLTNRIGNFLEMGYASSWSSFFKIFPCWKTDGSVEGLCRQCYQEALRAFERAQYRFDTNNMELKNTHRRTSIDMITNKTVDDFQKCSDAYPRFPWSFNQSIEYWKSIGRQNDSFASYCNETNPNFTLVYDTQEPFTEWETRLYTPFYLMTDYWFNITKNHTSGNITTMRDKLCNHGPTQGLTRFIEFSMVLLNFERNSGETLIPLASKSSATARRRRALPVAAAAGLLWGVGAGLICFFTSCIQALGRLFRWLG